MRTACRLPSAALKPSRLLPHLQQSLPVCRRHFDAAREEIDVAIQQLARGNACLSSKAPQRSAGLPARKDPVGLLHHRLGIEHRLIAPVLRAAAAIRDVVELASRVDRLGELPCASWELPAATCSPRGRLHRDALHARLLPHARQQVVAGLWAVAAVLLDRLRCDLGGLGRSQRPAQLAFALRDPVAHMRLVGRILAPGGLRHVGVVPAHEGLDVVIAQRGLGDAAGVVGLKVGLDRSVDHGIDLRRGRRAFALVVSPADRGVLAPQLVFLVFRCASQRCLELRVGLRRIPRRPITAVHVLQQGASAFG